MNKKPELKFYTNLSINSEPETKNLSPILIGICIAVQREDPKRNRFGRNSKI
jgi:hypothetical protein